MLSQKYNNNTLYFKVLFNYVQGGPEHRGIFVRKMLVAGSAAVDGRLVKGDRIVEINGVSLDGLNRYQVNCFINFYRIEKCVQYKHSLSQLESD